MRELPSSPLDLEPRACLGEAGGELVDDIRHEGFGRVDALWGIVDDGGLNIVSARAKPSTVRRYEVRFTAAESHRLIGAWRPDGYPLIAGPRLVNSHRTSPA